MIELTRPDLVAAAANSGASVSDGRSRTSGVTSTSQVAEDGPVTSRRLSTNDAVFFPSDMSSWTVDDVVQFVQSLKGCEEYSQVNIDKYRDNQCDVSTAILWVSSMLLLRLPHWFDA